MDRRPSLRTRLTLGLVGYLLVITVVVGVGGFVFNEHAERLVWASLLDAELDHFLQRRAQDPGYAWPETETLSLFSRPGTRVPDALAELPEGVHDEVPVDGRLRIVLVRDAGVHRYYMTLDVTRLEAAEFHGSLAFAGLAFAVVLLMAGLAAWSAGRLTRPLTRLSQGIGALRPQAGHERLDVDDEASSEIMSVTNAFNDYLVRHEQFAQRERAFIDTTSHELRTPIAVIAGAASLALEDARLGEASRKHLVRITDTAADIDHLITLLLILAKDPQRLATHHEDVALDALLPEIVEAHRHLCVDKDLVLSLDRVEACRVLAPLHVVPAAIGNVLRNAIENSDRGTIAITLDRTGLVTIEDPGHGMSADEVSRIYARLARGTWRRGTGIGLQLIGRLCAHLGWTLVIDSSLGVGSRVTLDFGASLRR